MTRHSLWPIRASRRIAIVPIVASFLLLGMLGPMDLSAFRERARCGFVVEVEEVRQLAEPPNEKDRIFDVFASFAVVDAIGACDRRPAKVDAYFCSEVHSSQPVAGERALLFLSSDRSPGPREAIYGRSYWRLREIDNQQTVEITWRNRFLLEPLELKSGEVAYIPLSLVERLWGGSQALRLERLGATPQLDGRLTRSQRPE